MVETIVIFGVHKMTIAEYEKEQEEKDREIHYQENIDFFECCKCGKIKQLDEFALKHCAGEFECINCYAKSMDT